MRKRYAFIGAALVLGAPVVCFGGVTAVSEAVTAVRGVRAQKAAEGAWPEQRKQIEAVVASVALPPAYIAIECEQGVGDRCWRVQLIPSQTTHDLATALSVAGVLVVERECTEESWTADEEPAGCAVIGTVAGRRVAIIATRDLDRAASTPNAFAGTSSVSLGADLSAP